MQNDAILLYRNQEIRFDLRRSGLQGVQSETTMSTRGPTEIIIPIFNAEGDVRYIEDVSFLVEHMSPFCIEKHDFNKYNNFVPVMEMKKKNCTFILLS